MEWTREMRYRPYQDYSAMDLLKLQRQAGSSPYQLHYHIHPASGLLNDPNGFSFFNHEWHVSYQSFPFGAAHGLKSWMHMSSTDLVHWQSRGMVLTPDNQYDSHGAYSGSALATDGRLFLMYTGNHRDADWQRTPYQLGAWMDKDGQVTKLKRPLFTKPANVSEHFRDPQLLEHQGHYYAIIGAQTADDEAGHIDLWESDHLEDGWHEVGLVQMSQYQIGYMVECPNLVFVDDHAVMIFCPQGLNKQVSDYQNIYPNMYLIGDDFDFDHAALINSSDTPVNLDYGFDVYASQAFNAPDGRAYVISWVGLPDTTYPTDSENWANCLSQVKELHIRDGKLYQQPVDAMRTLRIESKRYDFAGTLPMMPAPESQQYELAMTIEKDQTGTLHLLGSQDNKHSLTLQFDTKQGRLVIDRGKVGLPVATDHGTTRTIPLPEGQELKLHIYIDHSLAEIFINDGIQVATLRYFANQNNNRIYFNQPTKVQGSLWPLSNM